MDLSKRLIVMPGEKVRLSQRDPDDTRGCAGKEAARKSVAHHAEKMLELQQRLWAERKRSLLVVLQGTDTAGKDGTIRHVMAGVNPSSCKVKYYTVPSAEEASHDFLWRIHKALPAKGEICIFNRSHYEDIVAVRVEKLAPKDVWSRRYEFINEFEEYLTENGVTVLKFLLHISKDEQEKRLMARVNDPAKNWKLQPEDFEKRKRWDEYAEAYEDVLRRCSTRWAPWYVIPSNHKWFRNYAVSQILVDTLEKMDPKYPKMELDLSKIPGLRKKR